MSNNIVKESKSGKYVPLQDILDIFCADSRIQIHIQGIYHGFYIKELDVSNKYKMHFKHFCDIAKSTPEGFNLCICCKMHSNHKAAYEKKPFFGHCPFGLYEYVRPIEVFGDVICILYIGNMVIDRSESLFRIKKAARLTGVDEEKLTDELRYCENTTDASKYVKIAEILESYIRLLYEKITSAPDYVKPSYTSSKLWEILDYVNYNYTKNITLKQLSKLYFINEKYLGKLLNAQYKMPFHEYLNNLGLKAAENLLKTTSKSIIEIAFDCGYQSVNYFNRRFYKKYNVTPSQYRKKETQHTEF